MDKRREDFNTFLFCESRVLISLFRAGNGRKGTETIPSPRVER